VRSISTLTAFGLAVEIGDWHLEVHSTTAGPYNNPSRLRRLRCEEATCGAGSRRHAGERRLHERWISYLERRKRPVIANVAIARELSGWCWSGLAAIRRLS
jgi:hypothetical protein